MCLTLEWVVLCWGRFPFSPFVVRPAGVQSTYRQRKCVLPYPSPLLEEKRAEPPPPLTMAAQLSQALGWQTLVRTQTSRVSQPSRIELAQAVLRGSRGGTCEGGPVLKPAPRATAGFLSWPSHLGQQHEDPFQTHWGATPPLNLVHVPSCSSNVPRNLTPVPPSLVVWNHK